MCVLSNPFAISSPTLSSGKLHPRTGHEGPEVEWKYSSTLSLTSALEGGGWLTPITGRFAPEKDLVPFYRGLVEPQVQSGRVRNISPPPGFNPRTVQPITSAIPTT